MGRPRPRLRALCTELVHRHPDLEHPDALITAGEVLVNGFPRTNPSSLVAASDTIIVRVDRPLRGTAKLTHALGVFGIHPEGRVAVDLDAARVPEPVGLITMDLSYLSIAAAVPQLRGLRIAPRADLIALVKPAFELSLPEPPADPATLAAAVVRAADGLQSCGWRVRAHVRSPVRGARGSIEYLIHAQSAQAQAPQTAGRDPSPRRKLTTAATPGSRGRSRSNAYWAQPTALSPLKSLRRSTSAPAATSRRTDSMAPKAAARWSAPQPW